MADYILREAAVDAVRNVFRRVPTTAIRAMDALEHLPSVHLSPCDVCKHRDDCGKMRAYCPAEEREGETE